MTGNGNGSRPSGSQFEAARREMVERQIRQRGIRSPRVLEVMASVPRHHFVSQQLLDNAYRDEPLPIGESQTISQPFMVAAMAEALSLEGSEKILEVGAGSGYQAAVLSLLAREVISVESQSKLAASARERLVRLGYSNVRIVEGDGSLGWPADAPYDAILVTAAAPAVPPPMLEQLAEGGRLVIPVGSVKDQELLRVTKIGGQATQQSLFACRFVPLLGRYGWQQKSKDSSRG
jgi:protein-L-isoaspartate(D-aspartate) O-methyltransferase